MTNMNKKIFGIKISVILTVVLCLLASFLIWFYIKYSALEEDNTTDTDKDAACSTELDDMYCV